MNLTASAKARRTSRVSLVIGAGIIAGIFTLNAAPASADSTWDLASTVSTSDDSTWDTVSNLDDSTWDAPADLDDSTWD
ncbi:hypothetical protein [Nonomuraea jiangxiensis]|uniref:Uncharacterized protein n=1 Tax=Nonomuraea jiangxiensis TaxID=633440 RepID=A0A1G9C1F5_9ACTN|nr:hypothetical protein [Nonomuraea jiangxiensis]SDK45526.1 hypothetical protein SAMN05421869_11641 [Nonomuraea jiangxiensis]